MPVACQPDPAVTKRTRRVPHERAYAQQEYIYPQSSKAYVRRRQGVETTSETMDDCRKYEGLELNTTKSRLDSVLARYENIFGEDKGQGETQKAAKIAQILKPKVNK